MQLKVLNLLEVLNMHLIRAGEVVRLLGLHGIVIDAKDINNLPHVTPAMLSPETMDEAVESFLRTIPGYEPDGDILPLRASPFSPAPPKKGPTLTNHNPTEAIGSVKVTKATPDKVEAKASLRKPKNTRAKRVLSPEARERIVTAQKKRWEAHRANNKVEPQASRTKFSAHMTETPDADALHAGTH